MAERTNENNVLYDINIFILMFITEILHYPQVFRLSTRKKCKNNIFFDEKNVYLPCNDINSLTT